MQNKFEESVKRACVKKVETCFRTKFCKWTHYTLELGTKLQVLVLKHNWTSLIMQKAINHDNQYRKLNSRSSHFVNLDLIRWSKHWLRLIIILQRRPCWHNFRCRLHIRCHALYKLTLRRLYKVFKLCKLFDVPNNSTLFMLVHRLHRCVEQTSHKSRHILYRTVNQKLLNNSLTRERLTQPQW